MTRRTALHAIPIALVLVFAGGSLAQRKPIVVHAARFTNVPHGWRVSDRDFGFLTRRGAGVGSLEIRRLPLRLPGTTSHRLEGDSRVLEFHVAGRMDESYNVDLRVDVNRLHLGAAMLRRAQAVVSGLRFPRWPKLKRC